MREEHRRGFKEWDEFIRSLDAAVVLGFLIEDMEAIDPSYFVRRMAERVQQAFGEVSDRVADGQDEPDPDMYLLELSDQLHESGPPEDLAYLVRGLAVTAIHSALDAYVAAIAGEPSRPLPERLDETLRKSHGTSLDRKLYNALVEFDATRHLVVHNRGVIDSRYVSRVPDNKYLSGETRPLPLDQVVRYAHLALACGHVLHRSVTEEA